MRTSCCHTFLAFILKFLIFFQTFIGISIIVYSAYMLNQWNKHFPVPPSPSAPSPDSFESVSSIFNAGSLSDQVVPLNLFAGAISSFDAGLKLHANSITPWFLYAFMGVGVILCCISCIGHIAAEAINGCCLCFYTLLKTVLILLEVAFVAFIALDHHWERDLPPDPTGELDSFREFVEANIDLCKWVGIVVIIIQVLCLLLAMILRSMVSSQRKEKDGDIEEDSDVRGRAWEPLLNSHASSGSVSGDGKAFHSDIWSSRMREKYGLSGGGGSKYGQSNQSASVDRKI